MSGFLDLSLEASMVVSGVVYSTGGAICLKQLVVTLYLVTVTFLSLLLDVVCVRVLHPVFELVFGVRLGKKRVSSRVSGHKYILLYLSILLH